MVAKAYIPFKSYGLEEVFLDQEQITILNTPTGTMFSSQAEPSIVTGHLHFWLLNFIVVFNQENTEQHFS